MNEFVKSLKNINGTYPVADDITINTALRSENPMSVFDTLIPEDERMETVPYEDLDLNEINQQIEARFHEIGELTHDQLDRFYELKQEIGELELKRILAEEI